MFLKKLTIVKININLLLHNYMKNLNKKIEKITKIVISTIFLFAITFGAIMIFKTMWKFM
jgi:hypothetical protein